MLFYRLSLILLLRFGGEILLFFGSIICFGLLVRVIRLFFFFVGILIILVMVRIGESIISVNFKIL